MLPRIVLTGGPGAGKTTICSRLAAESPGVFVHVPEAASQVYELLKTRWDRLDLEGRQDVQRRIYRLQLDQEADFARQHPGRVLLLDRGSVDGAAYWPDGGDSYWHALQTSHAIELSRYDAVIWLESCAAIGAYDGRASNPCRFEDARDAIETGVKLAEVWRCHTSFLTVQSCQSVETKIDRVRRLLQEILTRDGQPHFHAIAKAAHLPHTSSS